MTYILYVVNLLNINTNIKNSFILKKITITSENVCIWNKIMYEIVVFTQLCNGIQYLYRFSWNCGYHYSRDFNISLIDLIAIHVFYSLLSFFSPSRLWRCYGYEKASTCYTQTLSGLVSYANFKFLLWRWRF